MKLRKHISRKMFNVNTPYARKLKDFITIKKLQIQPTVPIMQCVERTFNMSGDRLT